MNSNITKSESRERESSAFNGWGMLLLNLTLLIGTAVWLFHAVTGANAGPWLVFPAILLELVAVVLLCGYFTLQPNEARVLILFGEYKGTARRSGFHWVPPRRSNGKRPPGPFERIGDGHTLVIPDGPDQCAADAENE